ncbi:uncharacterized protein LOC105662063 [Megachile rotundata]|uniref:uncharacterized protein LOC105662063 n=1 Tax=Megachile rotundata TaxID=143995 RepID=UPI000614EAA3|nr:PREDICTED: uncharacterized protein LOC105662063 [Megachile rotundata]
MLLAHRNVRLVAVSNLHTHTVLLVFLTTTSARCPDPGTVDDERADYRRTPTNFRDELSGSVSCIGLCRSGTFQFLNLHLVRFPFFIPYEVKSLTLGQDSETPCNKYCRKPDFVDDGQSTMMYANCLRIRIFRGLSNPLLYNCYRSPLKNRGLELRS